MKTLALIALILSALPISADEIEIDLSQFGEPIEVTTNSEAEEATPETELDREIEAFRALHGAYNAVLINNSAGRALNKEGKVIGSEGLGTPVNPHEVLIIARAMVADPVVKLYTSIKKVPDCAQTVRILYTESPDLSESSLLGYTIENPKGVYTKLVKYDGKTPWLEWITESFKKDDGEQGGAGQPATASESKSDGKDKPQPESKVAPR
jgi:hypothetical protein